MAGTSFPEGLKPLHVYNFHRCVGNNQEIIQACGGVLVLVVEVVSNGLGGCKDATINEGVGWSIKEEKT